MSTQKITKRQSKTWLRPWPQNQQTQGFYTRGDWLFLKTSNSRRLLKTFTSHWRTTPLKLMKLTFTIIWESPFLTWICLKSRFLHWLNLSNCLIMKPAIFMKGLNPIFWLTSSRRLLMTLLKLLPYNPKIVMRISEGRLLTKLWKIMRRLLKTLKRQNNWILSTQNWL